MNTRCYRCGWSFSLSREALEEAAVTSAGQKAHVIHCPRCRQVIRIPMDQIMRALPPGWTPPAPTGAAAGADENLAAEDQPAVEESKPAEAVDSRQVTPEPSEPADKPQRRSDRRHRHTSKTNSGNSAAVPAAKKSTHPN